MFPSLLNCLLKQQIPLLVFSLLFSSPEKNVVKREICFLSPPPKKKQQTHFLSFSKGKKKSNDGKKNQVYITFKRVFVFSLGEANKKNKALGKTFPLFVFCKIFEFFSTNGTSCFLLKQQIPLLVSYWGKLFFWENVP